MNGHWLTLAPGVHVRRHEELDLNLGAVQVADRLILIDTGLSTAHGHAFRQSLSEVLPSSRRMNSGFIRLEDGYTQVVLTHGHFDHVFGTGAFPEASVWAQEGCARAVADTGEAQRDEWVEYYRREGKPEIAAELRESELVPPTELVRDFAELIPGRVELHYLGRGHTDHDLVVWLPRHRVLFAGDLVEVGAPPAFEDAYPQEWVTALDRLLAFAPDWVVPGHGEPVRADYVRAQRDGLKTIVDLGIEIHSGRITPEEAIRRAPYPAAAAQTAYRRLSMQ
ncbi:MBL fold metallo-hydrolase [Pseudonocardiaceae bacterium YIM PH 21723]|nr:MBL fold metallo-hydrolase [Pseudonocardiaceae bacterium YIM PH 21723]